MPSSTATLEETSLPAAENSSARTAEPTGPTRRLIEYYTEVGPDIAAWSPSFNIHFGFYRRGVTPLRLEAMLDQMNLEVYRRLELDETSAHHVLDMGCGVGATARSIARAAPRCAVTGVTVVPWQVDQATRLTRAAGMQERLRFVQADYRAVPWPDGSFDAAYAIESSCYASGPAKADFLREAARVLKPGARLVVADGFRKHAGRMNPLLRACYETMCRWWRVDMTAEITAFREEAERQGFEDVRVEDISWRIAPSVMFIPLVTARFLWRELVSHRSRMTPRRWENALAPLLGLVVGSARSAFGYYLVSARRRA
jgi:MPBQ/MSBQ methyltransferase